MASVPLVDDLPGAWGQTARHKHPHLRQRPYLQTERLAEGCPDSISRDVFAGKEGDYEIGFGDIGGRIYQHRFTVAAKGGACRLRLRCTA